MKNKVLGLAILLQLTWITYGQEIVTDNKKSFEFEVSYRGDTIDIFSVELKQAPVIKEWPI